MVHRTAPPKPVRRAADVVDVLDRVLDKGIVIDAWLRVSLAGLDLLTVEARVVVVSIETYLTHWQALSQDDPIARPALRPRSPNAVLTRSRAMQLVVISRDRPDLVPLLRHCFESAGDVVRVMLDRRAGERRATRRGAEPDRRRDERRKPPPDTWSTFGFVVSPGFDPAMTS